MKENIAFCNNLTLKKSTIALKYIHLVMKISKMQDEYDSSAGPHNEKTCFVRIQTTNVFKSVEFLKHPN